MNTLHFHEEGLVGMTFSPRTTIGWLIVLGGGLWLSSLTVREHPACATAAGLATLLWSAWFVSRE
jgi:hypothetical protein